MMKLVILGAFQEELAAIVALFSNLKETQIAHCRALVGTWNGHEVYFCLTGIGTSAACIVTTLICEKIQPDFILFCGVAGGLKKEQQIGDLILADQIIDADLYSLPLLLKDTPYQSTLYDPHTRDALSLVYLPHPDTLPLLQSFHFETLQLGTLITSNVFPAPPHLFGEIKKLNGSAIDMESAGVFKTTGYYTIPTFAIRAISNLLDDSGQDRGTEPGALELCAKKLAACIPPLLHSLVARNQEIRTSAPSNQEKVTTLIKNHALSPHPEGGWYKRVFQSTHFVRSVENRYQDESRFAGTSIIYLLEKNDFSAWHSIQSDETLCFHSGDPFLLRILNSQGELQEVLLGTEHTPQFTVKAGDIFCGESLGAYSLINCVVTPGFDFKDFHLVSQADFLAQYPAHHELVRLTR